MLYRLSSRWAHLRSIRKRGRNLQSYIDSYLVNFLNYSVKLFFALEEKLFLLLIIYFISEFRFSSPSHRRDQFKRFLLM